MKKYYYPSNLKKKPQIFVWDYSSFMVLLVLATITIIIAFRTLFFLPLVLPAAYAFCSMRLADCTILDYLKWAGKFLFTKQRYDWR